MLALCWEFIGCGFLDAHHGYTFNIKMSIKHRCIQKYVQEK